MQAATSNRSSRVNSVMESFISARLLLVSYSQDASFQFKRLVPGRLGGCEPNLRNLMVAPLSMFPGFSGHQVLYRSCKDQEQQPGACCGKNDLEVKPGHLLHHIRVKGTSDEASDEVAQ